MTDEGRVRAAVVGAGRIAEEHLAALRGRPDVDVVAVCDIDPRLARRAAESVGAAVWTDAGRMFREERLSAVHITTPATTHVRLALEALDAGCRVVVVEKPVALSSEELQRLHQRAEERGACVVEDHNYRFNRPVREMATLLGGGALGDLRAVEARMSLPLGRTRFAQRADVERMRGLPAGVLHEYLPHLCYLVTWLLPEARLASAEWSTTDAGSPVTPDRVESTAVDREGRTARVLFESGVEPSTTSLTVRGSAGWASADLQLGTLSTSRARGTGPQLDPLVDLAVNGGAQVTGALRAVAAKLRGSPIYEGVGVLVDQAYTALAEGKPMPVSHQDQLRAVALLEAMVERRT